DLFSSAAESVSARSRALCRPTSRLWRPSGVRACPTTPRTVGSPVIWAFGNWCERSGGHVYPRPGAEPLGSGLFQLHGEAEQQIFASESAVKLHADRQAVAVETRGDADSG